MLDIKKDYIGQECIYIKLTGKLIYDTEEEVNLTFEEIISLEKNILLDLSDLNYINSSGLGIFINLLKNIKKINRRLVIINPGAEVRMLFEITSLDKMFEIVNTIDEAKCLISG
ncbi:MAG: STAS domain-containing protein [Candidatus Muiribacteriota bacterium]